MTLANKTALITGSTSGIGLAIARAMAREGANVVLNGFGDPAAIEAERAGIEAEFGVKAAYDGADMTDGVAIAAMIVAAEARFGGVDILVNNAGIQHVAPVDEFPVDKWNQILAINLTSAFHAMRAGRKRLTRRTARDRRHARRSARARAPPRRTLARAAVRRRSRGARRATALVRRCAARWRSAWW